MDANSSFRDLRNKTEHARTSRSHGIAPVRVLVDFNHFLGVVSDLTNARVHLLVLEDAVLDLQTARRGASARASPQQNGQIIWDLFLIGQQIIHNLALLLLNVLVQQTRLLHAGERLHRKRKNG